MASNRKLNTLENLILDMISIKKENNTHITQNMRRNKALTVPPLDAIHKLIYIYMFDFLSVLQCFCLAWTL